MKIARFDDGRTALVVDRNGLQLLDVIASLPALRQRDAAAADAIAQVLVDDGRQEWTAMIARWDEVRGAFQALEALEGDEVVTRPFDGAKLNPPLPSSDVRIFAVASNTVIHIQRAFKALLGTDLSEEAILKSKNDGTPPLGFTVWPSVVVGPDATVAPPRGSQKFDYEAECAVYVKDGGRYLDKVELWGYSAFNDLGVRDTHLKLAKEAGPGPFSFNTPKNFDSSKACGPWVVVDENERLADAQLTLTVNGQMRQDWSLKDLVYSFDEALGHLSHGLTLRPGDMLASGTGAGVAVEGGLDSPNWLKPGDVIEVSLEGAGVLRNTVGSW